MPRKPKVSLDDFFFFDYKKMREDEDREMVFTIAKPRTEQHCNNQFQLVWGQDVKAGG